MRTIITIVAAALLGYLCFNLGRVVQTQQNTTLEVSDDLQQASRERHEGTN